MRPVVGSVGVVHARAGWLKRFDCYVIQIGTQSRYNHTGIVSRVEDDMVAVIEAAPGGVRERILEPDELPDWRFEVDPSISPLQRVQMLAEARRLLGFPYDFMDILKFIFRFFTGRMTTTRKDYSDDRVVCSELVAWCLHVTGIDPWPTTAFGAVSPGDIAEWMFAVGHTYS